MFHSSSSSSPAASFGVICPTATPATNASAFPSFLPSSSSPSYYSLPTYYLPRSSHSLPLFHHHRSHLLNPPPFFCYSHNLQPPPALTSSSPPSSSSSSSCDFNAGPVRRVFSTGDLQGLKLNGMLASGENHNQEGGAISTRVARYSPEERKERIERYRSKRNHRNFHKKITYACRKTLADSRPRVRGRFARNGENEAEAADNSQEFVHGHNMYELQAQSSSSSEVENGREWLRQMQAALAADDENESFNEEDIWATISDVLSMNLLS